jgi:competence protein ComEC
LHVGAHLPIGSAVPRWYETTLPSGQTAFVSKQSTELVTCQAGAPATAPGGDEFTLDAIDVGTGLAVLIRGRDFALLFDGGSNDDLAIGQGNRLIAYLKTLTPSLTRIDDIILSHPHRDHVELLPDVLRGFQIGQVWNSGAYNDICGYRHFLEAIADQPSIQYHTANNDAGPETVTLEAKRCYGTDEATRTLSLVHGGRISDSPVPLGQGASMTFLYADGSKRPSFNENSLVVRVDLGSHRILLMGDAEAGGRAAPSQKPTATSIEGKLLACCAADLKADVLVAGHHGSKTSSRTAFLDAVGAHTFIVSSGPTRYATVTLPDAEVIATLEQRGQVFRTDLEDDACVLSSEKVGEDSDGKAGGCDDVVITLTANGPVSGEYRRVAE